MRFWALGGTAVLVACGIGGDAERRAPLQAEIPDQMQAHRAEAEALRDAVVQGDVAGARAAATALAARVPLDELPADIHPLEAPLREASAAASHAADLPALALAAARVASACGHCHGALRDRAAAGRGRAPAFPAPPAAPPPPPPGDLAAEMRVHQAELSRLWWGIVTDDQALLQAAAHGLATAALVPSGVIDSPLPPLATARELQVHRLGPQIARAPPAERTALFGELLGTCAGCHGAMRPGAPTPH